MDRPRRPNTRAFVCTLLPTVSALLVVFALAGPAWATSGGRLSAVASPVGWQRANFADTESSTIVYALRANSQRPIYLAMAGPSGGDYHAGHTSAHGHASGEDSLNPLDFRTDLALWTAVVFIVLLAILGPLAWSPIARALDTRERHLAEQFAEAARRLEKAEALLREYEQRLSAASAEGERIIQQAIEEAQHRAEGILAYARAEAEADFKRRMAELQQATDDALRQLVQHAAILATEIAGRLMRAHLDATTHRKLLDEALAQVSKVAASTDRLDYTPGSCTVPPSFGKKLGQN